jgi:hypothetical protein
MRVFMAKNCSHPFSSLEPTPDSPMLRKFHSDVTYQYLVTPHIPHPLHYPTVVKGLCYELARAYECFLHEDNYKSEALFQTLMKVYIPLSLSLSLSVSLGHTYTHIHSIYRFLASHTMFNGLTVITLPINE